MRGALLKPSDEERRERLAESRMDFLDAQLMRGELTQLGYDSEVDKIDEWVRRRMEGMK